MKLFLVRHGIAVDSLSGEIKTDAQRPLTPEGREEVELVAKALKKSFGKLEVLISSPLVRARQTAEIFQEVMKVEAPEICQALAPAGDSSQVFSFLKTKKAESIALFGHEPDMSELAQELLGSEFNIPFKKAGVCRIDIDELPPRGKGVLKCFLPPKLLRALFR
ncbi:MAG: phosphohistidine phosphatase SixA [Candidatus Obscuribacterales bacterium]|nr:phosphohistidine phosphatase SixA [Candidatus Obscuribacterales bacterium]